LNETELKQLLKTLHKQLNILREREAKTGGNAPLDLLNQIEDHRTGISLVEARLAGEIPAETFEEQLAPLDLKLNRGITEIILGDKVAGSKIQIGTLNVPVIPMILLALGLLGIFGFAAYRTFVPIPTATPIPGPTRMKGLFNVAVAEFGEVDADGQVHPSPDGQQLSQWVYDGLQLEVKSLPLEIQQEFQPLVWHDSMNLQEKGITLGVIPDDKAAAELAQKINAHMVIYGNLKLDQSTASFVPEFYVAPVQGEADEILGRHQFGAPIELQTPLNLEEQGLSLNIKLTSRTRALSRFTIGLMYDLLGDSDTAGKVFQEAIDKLDWDKNGGKEIFYYFVGRSALFLDRDEEAEAAFRAAVDFTNDNYARAYVGLGSVYSRRARRLPPEQRLETTDLQQAIENYQQAITRADVLLEPQTKISAQLGLGQAYRLQGDTYTRLDDFDKAWPLFDQTIAEIQPIVASLQTARQYRYLGQAYNTLGAAYAQQAYIRQVQGDKTGSIALYEKAREAYANCLALKAKAPTDEILSEGIIAKGCSPADKVAEEALTSLKGGS
jgi:tetratricopeptide (TPR) repeat protein